MINSFCTATLTVCCRYENECWILLENCKHSWFLDKLLNKNSTILIPGCELYFLLYVGTHHTYHGNKRYDAKLHEHFITPQQHQTRRLHANLQAQSRGKSLGGQTITSLLTCLSKLWKEKFLNVNTLFLVCEGLDTSLCFIKPEQVSWPLTKELKGKDWPSLQKINF